MNAANQVLSASCLFEQSEHPSVVFEFEIENRPTIGSARRNHWSERDVTYQRCGGGRRIFRKKLGGD